MDHPDPPVAALQVAIAKELRRFRIELERIGELLVSDEHFCRLYLDQLQAFDLLGQCADENAALLDRLAVGVSPDDAIAQVRLGVMLDRLRTAMTAAEVQPQAQPQARAA